MSRLPLLVALCCAALALPAAASAQSSSNPWLAERVLNFAHQGGEDEFPSNTLYAYKESLRAGADLLEIDVGATKDGRLVVLHDNTVDRTTNGTGSITDMTLAEIQRLDAAHWFVPGRGTVKDAAASAYRLRGVRTGARRPPKGYTREDFAVPSLEQVLRAFPRTGMNIEIKGRDGDDAAVYRRGAELLAAVLKRSGRKDIIVASFEQPAIDRFHALAPSIGVAPGIDGTAAFVLSNGSPGPGVAAFQVPITFTFGGQKLTITTPDFVKRAHEAGYAVHTWLSNDREDDATYRRLLAMCVDGVMAAKPTRFEKVLNRTLGRDRNDPCGTRVDQHSIPVSAGVGAFDVPVRRQGDSQEARRGELRFYAGTKGRRLLGRGSFSLASDEGGSSSNVKLTAAGRALVRGEGRHTVRATVWERGRQVNVRRVVMRGV